MRDSIGRGGITQTLHEAARVLKPSGEMLLVIINGQDPRLKFAFGPLLAHGGFRGASWWTAKVQESGFHVIETGTPFASLYILARK